MTGHLSPLGAVVVSASISLLGVALLIAATMLNRLFQGTWELFGLHPRPLNRGEVFFRYKLGPIIMIAGGILLIFLALLGSVGIGPTQFR
jgi:hypothetical protein